jgi:hypothetical protein
VADRVRDEGALTPYDSIYNYLFKADVFFRTPVVRLFAARATSKGWVCDMDKRKPRLAILPIGAYDVIPVRDYF